MLVRARRRSRPTVAGSRLRSAVALLAALVTSVSAVSADHSQVPPAGQMAAPPAAPTDLDALMARVLANRDQSWRRLQEYLLSERETFRLVAPDGSPMFGGDREYLWVARDGRAVRSPVRIDGVAVSDEARREAEARWERDEERRAEKAETRRQAAAASGAPTDMDTMRTGEPRFISEVQFLRFKFEPGNYYFVGRETLAGREVLRIEYYPTRLFADDLEDGRRERDEARSKAEAEGRETHEVSADDQRIEQALNKVTLVTLWVDPAVAQVVRYTFDNVDFNFLPGRSLVRVDAARATMTMGQPFPDVWLPESLVVQGGITLATGSYRAEYARRFRDYRQADVQVRFRVKDDK
jgi:hypothetical protein